MTKKKRVRPAPATAPVTSDRGLDAFARNDFDTAIRIWTGTLRTRASIAMSSALAEAHFRRACKNMGKAPAQALADLKASSSLCPADPIYLYHLGLAHHRLGDYSRDRHPADGGPNAMLRPDLRVAVRMGRTGACDLGKSSEQHRDFEGFGAIPTRAPLQALFIGNDFRY